MRRFGLLATACLLACVLEEKEIGESGNLMSGDAEGGSESGSEEESGSSEGPACTLIGCDDATFVRIIYYGLFAGRYEYRLVVYDPEDPYPDVETSELLAGCYFEVSGQEIVDTDCVMALPVPVPADFPSEPQDGILHIQFPVVPHASFILTRTNAIREASEFIIEYEDLYPNGPECGVGCTQGSWWMSMGGGGTACEYLEAEVVFELSKLRSCDAAADCGQVLEHTSCGCTREMVARSDADLTRLLGFVDDANANGCEFLDELFGSECDCPEADGYACVDNVCTWNYL